MFTESGDIDNIQVAENSRTSKQVHTSLDLLDHAQEKYQNLSILVEAAKPIIDAAYSHVRKVAAGKTQHILDLKRPEPETTIGKILYKGMQFYRSQALKDIKRIYSEFDDNAFR